MHFYNLDFWFNIMFGLFPVVGNYYTVAINILTHTSKGIISLISKVCTFKGNCWVLACVHLQIYEMPCCFPKRLLLTDSLSYSPWTRRLIVSLSYQHSGLLGFIIFANLMWVVVFHCAFNIPFPWQIMRLSNVLCAFWLPV